MRCHICNTPLKKPVFDKVTHKALPCNVCDNIISEAVFQLELEDAIKAEETRVDEDTPALP